MHTHRLIKEVFRHNAPGIIAVIVAMTVSNFVQASSAISIAPVVDLIIHPDLRDISQPTKFIVELMRKAGIPTTLFYAMLLFLILCTMKNALSAFSRYVLLKVSNSYVKSLVFGVYRDFLSSRWPFFAAQSHGVLANTVIRETERVGSAIEVTGDMLSSFLGIVFYLWLGLFISWELTLIVIFMLVTCLVPFLLAERYVYRLGSVHTQANNDFFGAVQETLSSAKLIIGYSNEEKSMEKVRGILPRYLGAVVRFLMIRGSIPLAFEPLGFLIMLSAIFVGVKFFGMNMAELFVLLYAFKFIIQGGLNIASRRSDLKNFLPSIEQIQRLREEAVSMAQRSGGAKVSGLTGDIVFQNVSFTYDRGNRALDRVSLRIPKGKMIAVIGRSGSGKTTLIDLLMGFYSPQSGKLFVGDRPFDEIDVRSWRGIIGYIPQEAALFNASVKDNLLWGKASTDDKDLKEALELSNSAEFVRSLPAGLDTIVGEHGVRLSGGQRQRLALARAILRRPDLLVLDEATSSLDSHSELLIQKSIENLTSVMTIVAVAHRLSTIKRSDYIYVMDKGRILEQGDFTQLVNIKDGEFLKTAQIQGVL